MKVVRPITAALLALFGLNACATYTKFENATADAFATIEGPLPGSREKKQMTLTDLYVDRSALSYHELGRRFEAGTGGLQADVGCALTFYDLAGRKRVQVKHPGVVGPTNYLGVPQSRIAARELRKRDPAAQPAALQSCESAVTMAASESR